MGVSKVKTNEGAVMDWETVIRATEFSDKAKCLAGVLAAAKIFTYPEIQDLPRRIQRTNSCGVDPYALVQAINTVFETGISDEEEIVNDDY